MKYILKRKAPVEFTGWKGMTCEDWQPTYEVLSGNVKKAVKTSLMGEQGYICCYCERRLTDDDSHIEHFRPQGDSAVNPLDFNNMLCSCQKRLKRGEPRHCGNLKGNWFDMELLISPFEPSCEKRFAFTGDGKIKAGVSKDRAAVETIGRLGLDISKLNDMRAKAIEPFLDESLSEKDMNLFVSGYLRMDHSGMYGEFWTTIRYLFENYRSSPK